MHQKQNGFSCLVVVQNLSVNPEFDIAFLYPIFLRQYLWRRCLRLHAARQQPQPQNEESCPQIIGENRIFGWSHGCFLQMPGGRF